MTDKYLIRILVVILLYCVSVDGIAGDDSGWSQHTVFFEFAGAGLLYSVNYEFYVTQSVGIRTGLGVFPPGLGFPMLLNFYKGKEKRLELGLGFSHLESFLFGDYDTANVILATV